MDDERTPGRARRIADARRLITAVLAGALDANEAPWLVEDDLLGRALATLARADPAWLRRVLADARYDPALRYALATRGTCAVTREAAAGLLAAHPRLAACASAATPDEGREAPGRTPGDLVRGLASPIARERDEAAAGLGDLFEQRAVREAAWAETLRLVVDAARREEDAGVCETLHDTIARAAQHPDPGVIATGDWSAVADLLHEDLDGSCLVHGIAALGATRDPAFRARILAFARHPRADVREAVATALAEIDGPGPRPRPPGGDGNRGLPGSRPISSSGL